MRIAAMFELFETVSSTVFAMYDSLDEALADIRNEIRLGGRGVAETWALGEHCQDGDLVCLAAGDALIDLAMTTHVSAAS
jgi:hypothetical protein